MNFVQAITSGFKNYVTFSGRAARSEFWFWVLFTFLGGIVTGAVDGALFGVAAPGPEGMPAGGNMGPVGSIFSLGTLLPSIAVSVRRLHDTNRSGWWFLIGFTIIGLIPLLIWYCSKGGEGDNRFGGNPLAAKA